MQGKKITRRLLDSSNEDGREVWIWDTDVRGFYARHQGRAGSSWWYGVKYRRGTKARYHVIAEDGTAIPDDVCERLGLTPGASWTPEAARREGERVRGLVRTGADADAERGTPTLQAFSVRYLEQHSRPFKKPRSVEEDEGLFERHLLKAFGDFRLDRIDQAAVTRFAQERKDTPTTANRALALLSHVFTKAGEWGIVPKATNPALGVPRYRERKIERLLSAEELARLGAALRALEAEGAVSPFGLAAIRLLVFTGARPAEVLGLTWDMVDLQRGVLNIPDSKTGAKVIHLNPPAATLLDKHPRIDGDPRVFPPYQKERKGRRVAEADLESAWRHVRDRAKLKGVRLYDAARHSFASIAVSGGASLYLVGGLLGHKKTSTTQRYAHLSADPLRAVNDAVGRRLDAALAAPRPTKATAKMRAKGRR
jgi:integrase